MKRLISITVFCVLAFYSAQNLFAGDFGIVAGAGFTGMKDVTKGLTTGYHAGLTYKFHLPVGFAIQPSLLYQMKRSNFDGLVSGNESFDFKAGYLEMPVSFQWGPDLLIFRPFLDVSPYLGYGLNNKITSSGEMATNAWNGIKRLEYGLGLGGGLEIWKIQVACRYNWDFGTLFAGDDGKSASEVWNEVKSSVLGGKISGVTLSVAILF